MYGKTKILSRLSVTSAKLSDDEMDLIRKNLDKLKDKCDVPFAKLFKKCCPKAEYGKNPYRSTFIEAVLLNLWSQDEKADATFTASAGFKGMREPEIYIETDGTKYKIGLNGTPFQISDIEKYAVVFESFGNLCSKIKGKDIIDAYNECYELAKKEVAKLK